MASGQGEGMHLRTFFAALLDSRQPGTRCYTLTDCIRIVMFLLLGPGCLGGLGLARRKG
jgi:hypothetical protein